MSDQVISLTSSDEEDDTEPASKKRKVNPILPECTLTLVHTKPIESANKTIETVSLDSDDEFSVVERGHAKKTKNCSEAENPVKTSNSTANVDLISLTDDEDDPPSKVKKFNGTNNSLLNSTEAKEKSVEIPQETVSIDDSDTEAEAGEGIESAIDTNPSVENDEKEKPNHSIVIDDSDDETEKENHCEKDTVETFPVHIKKTSATDIASASTSKFGKKHLDEHKTNVSNSRKETYRIAVIGIGGEQDELEEAKGLFKRFIRIVEEKIVDSTFEEILPKKVPIIRKYFNRSGTYVNDKAFKSLLVDSIHGIRKSSTATGANCALMTFHKVFEHLKSHVAETTIVVDEDNLPKIKKLEHTIKLLRKRIHQLEVAEVNFDDDEDSAYIMLDRYQCRLNKVYAKYCQYINRNPHSGRATYDRITFVNSSYNEINQALTRKYKNSLVFPSYFDLEIYISKVSKKEKLNLSESDIKIESKKCFKVLGSILQKKRRQELYDSHLDFVESSEDPATKDISLENVLKKNFAEGKEKIEKLYQKYVNKQEKGEDHVSTDEGPTSEESIDEDKKEKVKKSDKVKIKKNGAKTEKESKKRKRGSTDEHNSKHEVREDQEKTKENQDDEHNLKEEKIENHKGKKVNQEEKSVNEKENEDTGESKKENLEEKPKNQQDNEEDSIRNKENTTDTEKAQIKTQEELSVLDMQKQKEDYQADKDVIQMD